MTAVDSGSVNPDEYKILEDLNLDPIISFSDPGDFWKDGYGILLPIHDLEISATLTNKINKSNFWYISDLTMLSLANLTKRFDLTTQEAEELRYALSQRGITLPEFGEMAQVERSDFLQKKYSGEITLLRSLAATGSATAALYLAKLADHYLIPDAGEECYRKAMAFGSAQAANDLGAIMLRRKSYDREELKSIRTLFKHAETKGLSEAKENLRIFNAIVR